MFMYLQGRVSPDHVAPELAAAALRGVVNDPVAVALSVTAHERTT